jgi:hypothetical protein
MERLISTYPDFYDYEQASLMYFKDHLDVEGFTSES